MLCDVRIFGGRNLAYRRNTEQSSTRYNFGNKTDGWAELAVDGGTSSNFNDGSCTQSNSSVTLPQWWKVNLSHVFFIKRIKIVNRNIYPERLNGFTVSFMVHSVNKTVYSAPPNVNTGIDVEVSEFFSYEGESVCIEIGPGTDKPLTLCEVFVFGDCPVHQCGWECERYCYCNSSLSEYNKIEATCPVGGCVEKWAGTNGRCDYCLVDDEMKCPQSCVKCLNGSYCFPENATCLQICNVGQWGLDCSNYCGRCFGGDRCNQITGACPGQCEVGWWGHNCTSRCSLCKNATKCNKNNGECEICEDGQWGVRCDKTCGKCMTGTCNMIGVCIGGCTSGFWGTFCNQSCGYCMTNTTCKQNSGVCAQCPAGQWGKICNQSCEYCALGTQCDINNGICLQCKAGNWSLNCTLQCGQCAADGACDIYTSICIRGCLPGWYGDNCTTVEQTAQEEEDERKVVAIAASIGSFALCLVIVVVAFPMYRKRRANHLKTKIMHMTTKHSEDKRNIIYTNIDGNHTENTTVNTAYEVAHIILTSNIIDASIISQDKCRVDIDDMAQSNSSKMNVYHNEMGLNKTCIPLADLPHYFRKKTCDSKDLEIEFEKLPKTPQTSMPNVQMPENTKKNCCTEIYAYDNSRVELPTIKCISGSDCINACFTRGFEKKRAYIASQAPTEAVVDDFWRMIWHYGVDKIVMLTELVEEGKTKCTQYWPMEGKCIYGSTEVEYLTEDVFAEYTIRKLKIQQLRIVTQFHFTAWPKRGVPETPSSLVQFWSKVRNTKGNPDMPIIVHCSAGFGRTGTFIALDYLYEEGKQTGSVNVFACVYDLRQQRVNMVKTKEQYVFLHEAIVEVFKPTMACVPSVRFHEKYQNLLRPDRRTGKCLLQTEFETLMEEENLRHSHDNLGCQAGEPEDGFTDATLSENGTKHRYDDIAPASSENDNINAVILPSHKSKNAFLLTQTPLPNTILDFLRLVLNNEVHTIVMFDDEKTTEERVGVYWPMTGGHASYGQIQVDVQSTGHTDSHQYRLLNLTRVQTGEALTVKQFICTFWKQKHCAPPNCKQFLAFVEAIETWQSKNKSRPIVVHCLKKWIVLCCVNDT